MIIMIIITYMHGDKPLFSGFKRITYVKDFCQHKTARFKIWSGCHWSVRSTKCTIFRHMYIGIYVYMCVMFMCVQMLRIHRWV